MFLLVFLLGLVTIVSDLLILSCDLSPVEIALLDSFVHAATGSLVWLVVIWYTHHLVMNKTCEVIICGSLSVLLDSDYLIPTSSISFMKTLCDQRPLFHCISIVLAICVVLMLLSQTSGSPILVQSSWLVTTAVLGHLIRDAAQNGFWICPLEPAPPLPYCVYITMICALPYMIRYILHHQLMSVTKYQQVSSYV